MNPYNHQEHLYDKNQPENLDFLRRLRAVMTPYGAAAVGEVGDAQLGLEILGQYTAGDDLMQMCYAFEFLAPQRPDAQSIVEVLTRFVAAAPDGWATWAYSNHDVVRHATRWQLSEPAQKCMATLLMCLRGSACLYQGEELGLPEADVAFEDLQDPYGIEFWPEFKGRDGCRTPMVWERSNDYGGFTTGRPWLPVAAEHLGQAVQAQEDNPDALLHHYRRAVALRTSQPTLSRGSLTALQAQNGVLSFMRTWEGQDIFCAFNLSDAAVTLEMPSGSWTPLALDLGSVAADDTGRIALASWDVSLSTRA